MKTRILFKLIVAAATSSYGLVMAEVFRVLDAGDVELMARLKRDWYPRLAATFRRMIEAERAAAQAARARSGTYSG